MKRVDELRLYASTHNVLLSQAATGSVSLTCLCRQREVGRLVVPQAIPFLLSQCAVRATDARYWEIVIYETKPPNILWSIQVRTYSGLFRLEHTLVYSG